MNNRFLAIKISLCVVCCWLLAGCIEGSSNPFYTPDLVVEMPELNGTWYFDENVSATEDPPLVISSGKLTIYDNKGAPADVKAVFFKIDDSVFIDIFPDEGELKESLSGDGQPAHLINQIKMKDGKISFNPLDYDWLVKEVNANRVALPYHMVNKNEDVLFTASSEQWVAFLRAHKDDPKAFPPENEAWLVQRAPKESAAQ